MAPGIASVESQVRVEDVLALLPLGSTAEYGVGQTVYSPDRLSKSIYLVVSGKVTISQVSEAGNEVLLDIVRPDELFGESAFLCTPYRPEQAVALERSALMNWPIPEIADLIGKRPHLGVALLQVVARRNAEFSRRIESLALDTIEQRLARALLRFSERLGNVQEDGSVRLMPLTHELLSRYVGTSREIVTQYMNRFRRRGYVSYSRLGIVADRDRLIAFLNHAACPSAALCG